MLKNMEKKDIDKLKEDYDRFNIKYNLPEFEKIGEDFDVEKIAEKESSFLLREIRRTMNEKIIAYVHLFETFMNPSSAPMFIFSILKNFDEGDKKLIRELYKELSKKQLKVMQLDTLYSEEGEADFIVETFNEWQISKNKIFSLLKKFEKDYKEIKEDTKAYFG